MLGLVREEQRRWWRLAFLAEEIEFAQRHLDTDVADARDSGWSWRRLEAATGIPRETLRLRHERQVAQGCDVPPAGSIGAEGRAGRRGPAPATTSGGPA